MKWGDLRRSSNVEDMRGNGGGGMIPLRGGLGLGGLVVVVVGSLIFGVNPMTVLSILNGGGSESIQTRQSQPRSAPANDQQMQFVSAVLGDMEDTWSQLLPQTYRPAKLVLFTNSVNSACGYASSAVGPFYCPANQKVYLDLGFFDELSQRYQAAGDFAQAYVIAHEVGHHIQTLSGISEQVRRQQQGLSKAASNQLSVKQELQADCYAGLWGHYAQQRNLLEFGDVDEALRAASQIGDDAIQKRSQGYVVPESFTHGSSAQRKQWFNIGLKNGRVSDCNTFAS